MSTEITITIPEHELGKAMRALVPQQRAFVYCLVETGGNATSAARAAGYGAEGTKEQRDNACRVRGYQLAHNPKVLAAIKEEADKRLHSGALLAASALLEMVNDPLNKNRFKAAVELLNRGGLIVETKHTVNVNHSTSSDRETIDKITLLAKQMGLDPSRLLGQAGVVIDAEFEDVTDAPPQSPSDPGSDLAADPWTILPDAG